MPNLYARLSLVKSDQAGLTATTLDDLLSRQIEQVSREWDDMTGGRLLYSQVATRYFTPPKAVNAATVRQFWIPDDVISLTSLKVDQDGDGVYETTLVSGTDYRLWPLNPEPNTPYQRIDLNTNSSQLNSWPTIDAAVQAIGVFGYSNETELTGATAAEAIDTTETAIDLSASGLVEVGDTAVIESEQMAVTAVSTSGAFPMTVVRGINGTTAAAHNTGTAVYRRRFPRDVERVVAERVVSGRWQSQGGYEAGAGLTGDGGNRASYARWMQIVNLYRRRCA